MTPSSTIPFQQALDHISGTSVDCFEAGMSDLRYAGNNSFRIGADTYDFAPSAWNTLAGYLLLPSDLLPQLGRGLGELVVKAISKAGRRSANAPGRLRLACDERGIIVAASSAECVCLTNQAVVGAIRDAWPSRIPSETLSVCLHLTEADFELTCHTPQLTAEPRPGDILHGGLTIRHSQAGTSATVVLSHIHRLVCSNGMTQRVCLQGKPSRTKRCNVENSHECTLEAIRRQVRQAWAQLDQRLEGMKTLLEHRLDMDELPEALRRRWSINHQIALEIAAAIQQDELGRTYTEYDLMNALSRVATHNPHLAPRYRRHLSLAAGMFAQHHVHRCDKCGSWVDENIGITARSLVSSSVDSTA